jgi:hypothetical protein
MSKTYEKRESSEHSRQKGGHKRLRKTGDVEDDRLVQRFYGSDQKKTDDAKREFR